MAKLNDKNPLHNFYFTFEMIDIAANPHVFFDFRMMGKLIHLAIPRLPSVRLFGPSDWKVLATVCQVSDIVGGDYIKLLCAQAAHNNEDYSETEYEEGLRRYVIAASGETSLDTLEPYTRIEGWEGGYLASRMSYLAFTCGDSDMLSVAVDRLREMDYSTSDDSCPAMDYGIANQMQRKLSSAVCNPAPLFATADMLKPTLKKRYYLDIKRTLLSNR